MTTPTVLHLVLVRWKRGVSPTVFDDLTSMTAAFTDTIPGVLAVSCGPNSSPENLGGGFDCALIITFASSAARDNYLPHPAHTPVAQLISHNAEQVLVFDVDE